VKKSKVDGFGGEVATPVQGADAVGVGLGDLAAKTTEKDRPRTRLLQNSSKKLARLLQK
jgi:hypothetical protein